MYPHFQQLRPIDADTSALPNDLRGIDQVFEDLIMNIGQSAGPRSLLLDTRVTSGLGKRASLGDKDDMTFRKLLLQLPC